MLNLHVSRRHPVLCHSRHATELHVDAGHAWITVEGRDQRLPGRDRVLHAGDTLHLPPGARAVASGLPLATVSVFNVSEPTATRPFLTLLPFFTAPCPEAP